MGPTKKTSEPSSLCGGQITQHLTDIGIYIEFLGVLMHQEAKSFGKISTNLFLKVAGKDKMWGQLGIVRIQPAVTKLDGRYLSM